MIFSNSLYTDPTSISLLLKLHWEIIVCTIAISNKAMEQLITQPYREVITRCITLCFWNEHCSTRSSVNSSFAPWTIWHHEIWQDMLVFSFTYNQGKKFHKTTELQLSMFQTVWFDSIEVNKVTCHSNKSCNPMIQLERTSDVHIWHVVNKVKCNSNKLQSHDSVRRYEWCIYLACSLQTNSAFIYN